ncbi:TMEM175 family protein [soil metagenome]
MGKGRLEAFSDGVIAIIITIMVLELKAPHEHTFTALCTLWPVLLSYMLSFIFIGIYWNNHHHLWHAAEKVSGGTLWANLHLLFWLSLVPFATDWMGETNFHAVPVAVYGVLLLMCALAFSILVRVMIQNHGRDSMLAKALGRDWKGKISMLLYVAGIASAAINAWLAFTFYSTVAMIWLIPDRRIEERVEKKIEKEAAANDASSSKSIH